MALALLLFSAPESIIKVSFARFPSDASEQFVFLHEVKFPDYSGFCLQ